MRQQVKMSVTLLPMILIFFYSICSHQNWVEKEDLKLKVNPSGSVWNGDYMKSVNEITTAHIPFRTELLKGTTSLEKMLGWKEKNNVYFGKDGWLFEKVEKQVHGFNVVEEINKIQEDINYINSSLLLVPSASLIYKEFLPNFVPVIDEKKEIEKLYYQLQINDINVIDRLLKEKERYPLYYHTDAMWTAYSAYYAYLEYAEKNDLEPLSINDYEIKKVSENYLGNLYYDVLDRRAKKDTIYAFSKDWDVEIFYENKLHEDHKCYQERYLNKNHQLGYFFGEGEKELVIRNQNVKNKKELVIVGDESSYMMIPFLMEHYQTIYFHSGEESLDKSEFIKSHEHVTDLLYILKYSTLDIYDKKK